jgi:hypothetical protein
MFATRGQILKDRAIMEDKLAALRDRKYFLAGQGRTSEVINKSRAFARLQRRFDLTTEQNPIYSYRPTNQILRYEDSRRADYSVSQRDHVF